MDSRNTRRTAITATAALALALLGADVAAAHSERPDLTVTRVSILGTTYGGSGEEKVVGVGASLPVADTTRNRGAGFARRSTTRYFLARSGAASPTRESGIVLRGGRTVEGLAGRTFARGNRFVVVPNVAPGRYDFVACADARRRVPESSEGNNCRAAASGIRVRMNEAPSAVFIGGGAMTGAFMEDGAAAPFFSELTVDDADDPNLSGATVSITGGDARDWFFYADQLGITGTYNSGTGVLTRRRLAAAQTASGTYNSGTGVLTLRGIAPAADYRTALRSILYQNTGDAIQGDRVAQIVVTDAVGVPSEPARRRISITPVNDPPQPYMSADIRTLALIDQDSQIASATVQIVSGFNSGQDQLAFTDQLGITGTYNSGTGVLTLTGTASPARYQTALRSVTCATSGTGTRTFRVEVKDTEGASGFDQETSTCPW